MLCGSRKERRETMYIYIEEVVSIMLIANRHTQSYHTQSNPPPPKRKKSAPFILHTNLIPPSLLYPAALCIYLYPSVSISVSIYKSISNPADTYAEPRPFRSWGGDGVGGVRAGGGWWVYCVVMGVRRRDAGGW